MSTVYTDADKSAYITQALAHGYARADVDAFLSANPNDYGRLLSALAPQGGSSPSATSQPAPNPATSIGAPATAADGYLTPHLEVVSISAPATSPASTPGVSAQVTGLGAAASPSVTGPAPAFDWTPVFLLAAGVGIVAYLFPRK